MDSEIKEDLKQIKSDVSEIKVTLAVNTKSLETHMVRTEISERRLEKLESWTLGLLTAILIGVIGKLFIS
jgi:hypothetical protein